MDPHGPHPLNTYVVNQRRDPRVSWVTRCRSALTAPLRFFMGGQKTPPRVVTIWNRAAGRARAEAQLQNKIFGDLVNKVLAENGVDFYFFDDEPSLYIGNVKGGPAYEDLLNQRHRLLVQATLNAFVASLTVDWIGLNVEERKQLLNFARPENFSQLEPFLAGGFNFEQSLSPLAKELRAPEWSKSLKHYFGLEMQDEWYAFFVALRGWAGTQLKILDIDTSTVFAEEELFPRVNLALEAHDILVEETFQVPIVKVLELWEQRKPSVLWHTLIAGNSLDGKYTWGAQSLAPLLSTGKAEDFTTQVRIQFLEQPLGGTQIRIEHRGWQRGRDWVLARQIHAQLWKNLVAQMQRELRPPAKAE